MKRAIAFCDRSNWGMPAGTVLFQCVFQCLTLATAVFFARTAEGGQPDVAAAQALVLDTGVMKRVLQIRDGELHTMYFEDQRKNRWSTQDSDEFRFQAANLAVRSTHDYKVTGSSIKRVGDVQSLIVNLVPRAHHGDPHLVIEYSAKARDHFVRKKIAIVDAEKGSEIVRLEVEALTISSVASFEPPGEATGGGLGLPVMLGEQWFVGIEHPAGRCVRSADREISAYHFPSPPVSSSFSAVVGCRGPLDHSLDDAFEAYLSTIARPAKPMLIYNSWFDHRNAELTPARLRATNQMFEERLLKPYGLAFDAFVIDDGWQNPQSIWKPTAAWEQGFRELNNDLKKTGSHLGLWLPLNGMHLDTQWGRGQQFEVSDHRKLCYCLAGDRYQSALSASLDELVDKYDLKFLKHDFNFLECSAAGHGHRPTAEHGREANVVRQLAILTRLHERRPALGLAVTSNVWTSPWWLSQADFLWMGSYDYAENWRPPAWSKRQAEMTFRDATLHRLLRIEKSKTPVSALMTHGLIRGRYEGADADRRHDWWDATAMLFGRGTMLWELYISPELLSFREWEAIVGGVRWAKANQETLRHTRMIGGDPSAGDAYGYVHWSKEKGIACLRNPSARPTTLQWTVRERPGRLGLVPSWHAVEIYPRRQRLSDGPVKLPLTITLVGHEVKIIELYAQEPQFKFSDPKSALNVDSPLDLFAHEDTTDRLFWKWKGERAGKPVGSAELIFLVEPAAGVQLTVQSNASTIGPTATQTSPIKAWSLQQFPAFENSEALMSITASLPISPFWPTEANASLIARAEHALRHDAKEPWELETLQLPFGVSKWSVQEKTIRDRWTFFRRRSKLEVWAWFLVLGGLPVLAAVVGGQLLSKQLSKHPSKRWNKPRTAAALIAALLIALYTLTPVGSALGRVLGEF